MSPVLIFQLPRYSAYSSCTTKSPLLSFQLHRLLRVLKLLQSRQFSVVPESRQFSSSSSPDTPRNKVVLESRQFSSSSSPNTPRTKGVIESLQFSSSSSPDTPRTQVVLQSRQFSASSYTDCFAHYSCTTKSTRAISAEGCAGSKRTLACISRPQRARSPPRVAPDRVKSHSRLHFAHSTRAIPAVDARDLRRGLRRTDTNRTLACVSRTRHARSPQRVAPDRTKSHSCLHFAHPTRTISAEGCVSWWSGGIAPGLEKES